MNTNEDDLGLSIFEYWGYVLLGLNETANLRFGDPSMIMVNEYSFEDAAYCRSVYKDYE